MELDRRFATLDRCADRHIVSPMMASVLSLKWMSPQSLASVPNRHMEFVYDLGEWRSREALSCLEVSHQVLLENRKNGVASTLASKRLLHKLIL